MAAWVSAIDPSEFVFALVVATIISAAALCGALSCIKRKRVIEDTPPALVRSAAQGYIELPGSAELMDADPIYALLSGRLCTWYQFRVEHRETRDHNGKRRSRTPRRYDGADASWWAQAMGRMGGQYRDTEQGIEPGRAIYVVGDFITHGGAASRADSGVQTVELLREWKRDQTAILARFDANGDGEIDLQEWETVRVAAARAVAETQPGADAPPPVDVLAKTGDRQRPFIIAAAAVTEDQIVARYHRWATALVIIAIPLASATIWAAGIRFAA